MTSDGWWNVGRWSVAGLIAVSLLLAAGAGAAQDRSDIDVQNFEPALGPHAIFTVHETGTLPHLQPAGELVFDYLSSPLVEKRPDARSRAIVDQQLAADVLGGIGLTERGQIGVHLPFYLVNNVAFEQRELSGATVGDLTLTPKYRFVDRRNAPVGFGAAVDVALPTGDGEAFVGAPSVAAEPKLLVDARFNNTTLAANFGAEFQRAGELRNVGVGSRFTYSLGFEQEVVDGLVDVGGELYGHTLFDDFFGASETSPLEGILGTKVRTNADLVILAGSGGGLVPGVGAPEFRAFLGVSYPNEVQDADGDGIDDSEDDCPREPETLDGYEDSDGCPDPDNDGDGIPDVEDKCPNEAGRAEADGCPVEEKAETETDSDGDGIPDAEDPCPEEAEDEDGYEDDDGCPDPDNDADGVPDDGDRCPDEAEDEDGHEDEDGCPDADNDGDGIPDDDDECPDEAGLERENGCPAEEKKAVRKEEEIENLEKVFFEYDKAVLEEKSFDVLDQIGLILRTNADIKRVAIVGHTDDIGSEEYNEQLSEQRAKAVREYLVDEQDIDSSRLETKGLGATEPLVPNNSQENRQKNRRVEFRIVEQEESASGSVSEGSDEETSEESDESESTGGRSEGSESSAGDSERE